MRGNEAQVNLVRTKMSAVKEQRKKVKLKEYREETNSRRHSGNK